MEKTNPKWETTLKRVIPSIVSIRSITVRSFDTEQCRTSQATGFVVDSKIGIILSNRHVVQPGPVLADAIFNQSKEELKLTPIYRDPVHDFGFFKFNPNSLKYMEVTAIPLRPENARVGLDIRVVGNDSGERLSILSGTLARLDRHAPNYGKGNFNDWNSFYYQAASMTSGGSSGSPVLDEDGNAVALNAGGATKAATSFFLPLDRIVRALSLIQSGLPVSRGTLQTVFLHTPYDELKRLGLDEETETYCRANFHSSTGMLCVQHVIPNGPGFGKLQAGDVLRKIDNIYIVGFVSMEQIFDESIGNPVTVEVSRGKEILQFKIAVEDLHEITPDSYIEIGGGIVHELSYQMARSYMIPVKGVFVAADGYMLGNGGVHRKSVIVSIDNKPTPTIKEFLQVTKNLMNNDRVVIHFYNLADINKTSISIIQVDRKWHRFAVAKRNDMSGYWDYTDISTTIGNAVLNPHTAATLKLKESFGPARKLITSFVYVQTTYPFLIDGSPHQHRTGAGLVLDAAIGLILVDRNVCSTKIVDINITFANSIIIPATAVYIHQMYNFAILQYNPKLLGDTIVESAKLSNRKLKQGDEVYQVCLTKTYEFLVKKTIVSNVRRFFVRDAKPPIYRSMNMEGIEIENPIHYDGVYCDENGTVFALHAYFLEFKANSTADFYMGMDISLVFPALEALRGGNVPDTYLLEAELTYIQVAQARILGLSAGWVQRVEKESDRRNLVFVNRLTAGAKSSALLKPGDIILSVNDNLCKSFSDITSMIYDPELNLTILRDKLELELKVPTTIMDYHGTQRIVGWAGAIFQMPFKAVYQQLKSVPTGVLCSFVADGSPAQLYNINPFDWVTAVNDKDVTDLDSLLERIKEVPSDSFVRVKTENSSRVSRVVTVRTSSHYFGSWELVPDVKSECGWKLKTQF